MACVWMSAEEGEPRAAGEGLALRALQSAACGLQLRTSSRCTQTSPAHLLPPPVQDTIQFYRSRQASPEFQYTDAQGSRKPVSLADIIYIAAGGHLADDEQKITTTSGTGSELRKELGM
jgi:hypothetical protein